MKIEYAYVILSVATVVISTEAQSQNNHHTLMFYNVENLFHPADDSLTLDNEFTPDGSRHWTWYRYRQKITTIAKVILAVGEGDPPVIAGLCEVENSEVLSDLVNHPLLRRYDYRIIHKDSPDPRGIDVACLYRDSFNPTEWHFHPVSFPGSESYSRDILHIYGFFEAGDSIDLLINHWTSRYGGAALSMEKRMNQSKILGQLIDSLDHIRSSALIIAMGDFNDYAGSLPVLNLVQNHSCELIVPAFNNNEVEGSYKYQGRWSSIDHFLVHGNVSEVSLSATVFSVSQMLEVDEKYSGVRPRRTYSGFSYRGGASDHLPVLLDYSCAGR